MHHYSKGIEAFGKERSKQIEKGYTEEHDRLYHSKAILIKVALCYTDYALDQLTGIKHYNRNTPPLYWPWFYEDWKPEDTVEENLAKAGAFLAAAYDTHSGREKGNDSTTDNVRSE